MNDFLAWDSYAEAQKTARERRAEKAALTRKEKRELAAREREQRFDESDLLTKAYRHQRRQDLEKLLTEYPQAEPLMKFLRGMKISDSAELLRRVREPWLTHAPEETRFEVLRRVSHHIYRVREANGLPGIDDPIPWLDEKPNLFLLCKNILLPP